MAEQALARDLFPASARECWPGRPQLSVGPPARDFLATGANSPWRASASFRLTPIAVLADGSYLAQLHPRRTADGPPITVRVIEYTVHTGPCCDDGDGDDEDSSEVFCLVTDLLDPEAYPALDLAAPTRCAGAARR